MAGETVQLQGADLNRLLEALSLKVERMSLLIEDAMVDQSDVLTLERSDYNDLMICLAKYEELLKSIEDMTRDATDEVREILGVPDLCYGEVDADEEPDLAGEDEDLVP